jgi:hypothetical protein
MHRIPRRSSLAFGWRVEPQARASGLEQRAKLGIKRLSTMTMSPDFHAGKRNCSTWASKGLGVDRSIQNERRGHSMLWT